MVPSITDALLELIEKTMTWMERRLLIVTKGAKQHFFTSIILALVKARLWPDQAELLKQKLIEHISILAAAMLKRHQALTAGSRSYPGDDDSDNNLNINLHINDNSAVMKVSGVISGDNVSGFLFSVLSFFSFFFFFVSLLLYLPFFILNFPVLQRYVW